MHDHYTDPLRTAALFRDFSGPWGFCGGRAVDLFLDRPVRPHKDVDIAVLRRDQAALYALLTGQGWTPEIAHKGTLTPWPGEYLAPPLHGIWWHNENFQPPFLEVLLNEAENDTFLFRRYTALTRPLGQAFLRTRSGLPVLAPEIVVLYKAGDADRPENTIDFEALLPALMPEQRTWLANALTVLYPNHPWLAKMVG